MAHRLFPVTPDEYLEPSEIVRRLRAEFEFVDADVDEGTGVIVGMIEQFQRMRMPPSIIEAHKAMLGRAIRVIVSDREDFRDDYIQFTAMPGTAPLVGYHSGQHEDEAAPLLRRVCDILRYYPEVV